MIRFQRMIPILQTRGNNFYISVVYRRALLKKDFLRRRKADSTKLSRRLKLRYSILDKSQSDPSRLPVTDFSIAPSFSHVQKPSRVIFSPFANWRASGGAIALRELTRYASAITIYATIITVISYLT